MQFQFLTREGQQTLAFYSCILAAGSYSRVAVACDDGCLRIFRIEADEHGLIYESSLPALKHRLLSVTWHPNAKTLVTGTSDGSLHAWDTSSKREILRVHTGKSFASPVRLGHYDRYKAFTTLHFLTVRNSLMRSGCLFKQFLVENIQELVPEL